MATPQNDGGVSKALNDSKKLLNKVNNGNVASKNGKPFEPAAKNVVAGAAAKKATGAGIMEGLKKMANPAKNVGDEAESAAAGLKAKADNVAEYEASLPKMHKGGKVKKDGAHDLKKGEVVLTEKDAKKMGVKDGAKDGEKKPSMKKKKHGGKHTHIEHHSNGSHTMKVSMDDGSEQSSAHPDDASLMEAMQGQLNTPAPAPQSQGQGGGAPEPAAAGGAPA
jgi:hypothetical protein